ncbi:Midasin [Vitis vinifera]|uniref:Midasin n=1 Tax=Vitis vinifera TaxID=29760 RepID=A0A438CYW2_VITVI|nr:Midasin [Vitis vinifera]
MDNMEELSHELGCRNSVGVLWRRVMIGQPSNEDLQSIVKAWYPELEPLAGKLIGAKPLRGLTTSLCTNLGDFSQEIIHPSVLSAVLNVMDLLKWCKRIAALGFHFLGDGLSSDACKCIFLEAVDIFVAFSASAENQLTIMRELTKMWAVSDSVAEAFYPPNKPVIQLHHQKKPPFVEIRSSLHLLERIVCSGKCNEPVLFVGETGTGKTTLVQNLSMRIDQKLTNLSQQSDVADLLGGFKPMDAWFVCIPLYKEFENLFSNTFSVKSFLAVYSII